MSSNKFLQRFEGKIQVVTKEGVQNVFGGKKENVVVYTNNNFNPQNKNTTASSLNKSKPTEGIPKETRNSLKKISNSKEDQVKKERNIAIPPPLPKEKKSQNPFLISNPFYLDEEQKVRLQKQRKQREFIEKEKEKQVQKHMQDAKKTHSGNIDKSLEKKKNQKEWTKLGGLGANIGGDDWLEKKKKLDKMQEFSQQVKSINKDKPKIPKPNQKKQERKDVNPRQKALQYSKNVPKPVVRASEKIQQPEQRQQEIQVQHQLSQLQLYERRHQQLKNMVRNQL